MAQAAPQHPFRIELLGKAHDRTTFASGSAPLDSYLKTQAGQEMRRRIASCFVAVQATSATLAGYYTLSATGVPLDGFAPDFQRRLPRYPTVPAALVGRLAIAQSHQGRGLGKALLVDALRRAAASETMAFALIVEAKDETASAFYRHFGFLPLIGGHRRLAFPLADFQSPAGS